MTLIERGRPVVVEALSARGLDPGVPPRPARTEASWLISRAALLASRPDLGFQRDGRELRLSWTIETADADGSPVLHSAVAMIRGEAREPVRELFRASGGEPGLVVEVARDAGDGVMSIELRRDGCRVLTISISSPDADGSNQGQRLAYARTSLLGDAAPRGLGIAGGRYEFDGAVAAGA